MKKILYDFLDPAVRQSIAYTHRLQKELYGVYEPPRLKQLISLRHLLMQTGWLKGRDIKPEELLGFSRIECAMLLKTLNSWRRERMRNQQQTKAL